MDAARPAGFWQRAVAWTVDALVPALLAMPFSWPLLSPTLARLAAVTDAALHSLAGSMAAVLRAQFDGGADLSSLPFVLLPAVLDASGRLASAAWAVAWPPAAAFATLLVLWHGGFEASRWRAGPGKRLLGLRVTDGEGRPLGAGRALGRQLAGSLSWLTLNLGHLMAVAGPEHLALHDRIAGTRVVTAREGLPRWAWPWLLLAILMPAIATAWLLGRLAVRLQYLLEQALW